MYSNIVIAPAAGNSPAARTRLTCLWHLVTSAGSAVKNLLAGTTLTIQNTSLRVSVRTVVPHYRGYQKARKWLLSLPVRWMKIPESGQQIIYFVDQDQPGTRTRVTYRNLKRCRLENPRPGANPLASPHAPGHAHCKNMGFPLYSNHINWPLLVLAGCVKFIRRRQT